MQLQHEDPALNQELELRNLASTPEQEDRLSGLPDDILFSILQRLQLAEAARTSVLSTRWRHLFHFRSRIKIDIGYFHRRHQGEISRDDVAQINASMVKVTKSMLEHNSQYPISLLRIRFYLMEESVDIIRCVDNAMADRKFSSLHFLMYPEIVGVESRQDDRITMEIIS